MNLAGLFAERVREQGDHPAVIGPGAHQTLSYRDLAEEISLATLRLQAMGVGPSHNIGVHVPSGREYIVLTYAIWSCGACSVPIPVELKPEEKTQIYRTIALDGILSDDRGLGLFGMATVRKPRIVYGRISYVRVKLRRAHPSGFAALNAAFIRFSSGTTGKAKGVVLSHETVRDRIHAANEALRIGPDDRVIWLLSMSYHFTVSIVSYLTFGATIILCRNHLGGTILESAAEHRGTLIYASPVHYQLMLAHEGDVDLSSVRLAISTATSLPKDTAVPFSERFGIPLVQAYGIIEVGLPCIHVDGARSREKGGVGPPVPAFELRLEDVAGQETMKAIHVRGPGMFDAYYEPFMLRGVVTNDGWFATGDLGALDDEGCLHILGRSKEIINVGGMKFFPQEVERVLESHPSVMEACVFAASDRCLGEVPRAQVLVEPGDGDPTFEKTLRAYCIGRLAAYKVPQRVDIVEFLARTASGKPIRRETGVKR